MPRRVFGPVPSRRLGISLGVNNIPHKVCSYSCIYCQVGKAVRMQVNRQEFYKPQDLVAEVKSVLDSIQNKEKYPDYITIVPDGEPTLDLGLGTLIELLKPIKIPIAVITNASLIQLPGVRSDLMKADYISVKVDSLNNETWHKINKPCKELNMDEISNGIRLFSQQYTGKLVTETMLLKGINDSPVELDLIARFIQTIKPQMAYISIPTRPTAFKDAIAADGHSVTRAFHIFKEYLENVELLTGYEGNAFSSTGNFDHDILSITAVHPMRKEAVMELMAKANASEYQLKLLIDHGFIDRVSYRNQEFFIRRFGKNN